MEVLTPTSKRRVVSAEELVVRWMETRAPSELATYPQIVSLARGVISEAFSSRVITSRRDDDRRRRVVHPPAFSRSAARSLVPTLR